MKREIRTRPLARYLIGTLLLLLIAALVGERIFEFTYFHTRQVEQSQQHRVREMCYILARDFESDLLAGDDRDIAQEIRSRGVLANLRLLALTEENGIITHATRLALDGLPLAGQDPLFDPALQRLAAESQQIQVRLSPDRMSVLGYAPISLPPRAGELRSLRTGLLFVHQDLTYLKAGRWDNLLRWENLARWGLEFSLIALLLYLLLRRILFRPLRELERAARAFGRGELNAECALAGTGELKELCDSFNGMAQRLRENLQTLSESESKFRTLVKNIPGAAYRCALDREWTVEFISPGIEEITGYPPEDFVGNRVRSFGSLIHPEDADRVERTVREEVEAGRTYVIEYRLFHADGSIRWLWEKGRGQFDGVGRVRHLDGVFFDITDRRRVELELEEYRRHLEAMVRARTEELGETNRELAETQFAMDRVGIGIYWVEGSAGRIRDANAAACSMLGYSREEMLALTVPDLDPTLEGRRFQESAATICEQKVVRFETGNRTKEGGMLPVEVTVYHLGQTPAGEDAFIVFVIDISLRKAAEQALVRAKEAAESANRAKSVFLANMSHELRTPLNAILGFAQIIDYDADLNAKHRSEVGAINRSGRHLLSLINDVLEISRIEAGRTQLQKEPFNLAEALSDIEEMIRLRATAKGLELRVERPSALPLYVLGDANRLRQVLINLLGNAVKYTDRGEVRLVLESKSEAVGDAADEANEKNPPKAELLDSIRFEVSDTGPGIAPEDQERIFQAFYQTASGQAKGDGSGLGLAISWEYVRLMGGELTVRSEPGQGSRFAFAIPLPVAEAPPAQVRHGRVIGLAPGQEGIRVLVAEDQPDNRDVIAALLETVGFDVLLVENGVQAVERFQSWRPQVILMDMRMPVLDGYGASRRIRALPGGSEVRIIALTASAFHENREEILAAGCDELIPKPLEAERLFDEMGRLLGLQFRHAEEPCAPAPETNGGQYDLGPSPTRCARRSAPPPRPWTKRPCGPSPTVSRRTTPKRPVASAHSPTDSASTC